MDLPSDFETLGSIDAFIAEFRAEKLPKVRWTHSAHLVAGLWHIIHHRPDRALDELRERIRAHNEAVGTANTDASGYHETITRFYVVALDQAMCDRIASQTPPLALYHAVLSSGFADSHLPLQFYTKETLFSVHARREWVEPDIAPIRAPQIV